MDPYWSETVSFTEFYSIQAIRIAACEEYRWRNIVNCKLWKRALFLKRYLYHVLRVPLTKSKIPSSRRRKKMWRNKKHPKYKNKVKKLHPKQPSGFVSDIWDFYGKIANVFCGILFTLLTLPNHPYIPTTRLTFTNHHYIPITHLTLSFIPGSALYPADACGRARGRDYYPHIPGTRPGTRNLNRGGKRIHPL